MVDGRARKEKARATSLAGFGLILVGVLAMVLAGFSASIAGATQPNPEHKVTLCHRTDSRTNPYVIITPDVASVLQTHGHDSHNGPVFSTSLGKHVKWGDIIPPFDFGPGEQYAGQNWTSAGQAILGNGCSLPGTTTTSSTTTSVPEDTTTTTSVPEDTTTTSVPEDTTTTTSVPEDTTTTSVPEDTTTTSVPEDTTTTSTSQPGDTTLGQGPGTPIGGLGTPEQIIPGGVDASAGGGSGTLPVTGSPVVILLGIGAALTASGIGLVVRRRRWAR
jgi:LPXTG-motif cell wall-anchored protein